MLFEYYCWRSRRLHKKLALVQFKISEMAQTREAKKLNKRRK